MLTVFVRDISSGGGGFYHSSGTFSLAVFKDELLRKRLFKIVSANKTNKAFFKVAVMSSVVSKVAAIITEVLKYEDFWSLFPGKERNDILLRLLKNNDHKGIVRSGQFKVKLKPIISKALCLCFKNFHDDFTDETLDTIIDGRFLAAEEKYKSSETLRKKIEKFILGEIFKYSNLARRFLLRVAKNGGSDASC